MLKQSWLKYSIIICLLGMVNINLVAENVAPNNVKLTEKQLMAALFTRAAVDKFLDDCNDKITNGIADDDSKLSYRFYYLFAVQTNMWLKKTKRYPWEPELSTRIARSWYVDLYKTFMLMSKYRKIRSTMEEQKRTNSNRYQLAGKKFTTAYKHFLVLKKKPTKLTKAHYLELLKKKKAWEKKERAKAKATARAKQLRRR